MDEKIRYVLYYYRELLSSEEYNTWNLIVRREKRLKRNQSIDDLNWGDIDPEIDDDKFFKDVCDRIVKEEDIYFNICSICGQLATTPYTKRCRNKHAKVDGVWKHLEEVES